MDTFINELQKEAGMNARLHHIDELTKLLSYFADKFPFENLDVLLKNTEPITPNFLRNKLITEERGGLCYELNAFLYLVLKALRYDVLLTNATVHSENGWSSNRTHVLNIVTLNGRDYVLDTGFGSQLSRQPLEINGEAVTSAAGTMRVTNRKSEKGTHAFEKLESGHWILKYAFNMQTIEWGELDRIKHVITESRTSAFNRRLIISKCLRDKTISVNNERLRVYDKELQEEKTTPFSKHQELLANLRERVSTPLYKLVERYGTMQK